MRPWFSCLTAVRRSCWRTGTFYDLVGTVLIWNTAPGSSLVSAWTVALMPIAASAPLTIPQGNHRNYFLLSAKPFPILDNLSLSPSQIFPDPAQIPPASVSRE